MKVTLVNPDEDVFGSDLKVANMARVSFGKRSSLDENGNLRPGDSRLIDYLARGMSSRDFDAILQEAADSDDIEVIKQCFKEANAQQHWGPFGHCSVTLHIKAPVFIRTQCFKHKIGFIESEISRRYVDSEPDFFMPDAWRKRADNKKQGSSEELVDMLKIDCEYSAPTHSYVMDACEYAINSYEELIRNGVCPEQARMVLPQSMYTEWNWTGTLMSYARFYNQRTDPHAQKEIQDLAKQVGEIIEPLFPVSWKALTQDG